MDLGVREWMIIIGVLLIVAVVLDGYRRVRNERRGRIRVSLSRQARRAAVVPSSSSSALDDQPAEKENPELPNGGARPASRRRGFGSSTVPVLMQPAEDQGATRVGWGSVDEDRSGDDDGDSARRPADAWDDEPFADDETAAMDPFAEAPPSQGDAWLQSEDAGSASTAQAYSGAADDHAPESDSAGRHGVADAEASADESDGEWSRSARAASAARYDDRPVSRHDAAVSRNGDSSRYVEPDEAPAAPLASGQPQEVLVVYVVSRDRQGFKGQDLLQILLACDVRYAKSHLFYRYEEAKGQGRVQFGVANLTEAGTFELDSMEQQLIPGVCFFITLPGPAKSLEAFRCLVETAQVLVKNLDGEMRDESRSVMTAQTLEHYRQRIRDFERKQLTFHI